MHVGLIDDDVAVLDSLRLYLEHKRIRVSCYESAEAFLAQLGPETPFDCIVADVRMPGMSGLDLVRRIPASGMSVPTILITGHGDIDMAVAAIKNGAFDFIEKPFDESRLLEVIKKAADQARQTRDRDAQLSDLRARFDGLTDRQRQVMELAVAGTSNKEIGSLLSISTKTVENHRAWMMERMGARNLAELVRMAMRLRGES